MFTCEDIRQYYYCPRIIYFRYVLRARVGETYKMSKGGMIHESINLGKNVVHNVYLCCEDLSLVGIIDGIEYIDENTVDIIEIKAGRPNRRMRDSHKAQLAAQAMLVERTMNVRVRKIKVYNVTTREFSEVHIVDFHRGMVRHAIEDMTKIVLGEDIPDPTGDKGKCVDCEYRAYCDYIF